MSRVPKNPFDQFMEEAEQLVAPLKLVIRIIRRPKPQSPTAMSGESASKLKKFLGWDGFSFVFFTGLALAFLQLPYQFDKARWCFIAAAIALVIKIVHSVNIQASYPRFLITVLASVLAGLGVNLTNDWVSRLEVNAIARDVPQIRVIVTKAANCSAGPPPRSDMVFDGFPYFGIYKDDKGQPLADQNLKIGQPLGFNFGFKQTGPNPVDMTEISRLLYLEPDAEHSSQRRIIADFKNKMRTDTEPNSDAKETRTFAQGQGAFDTAFAITPDHHARLVTQDDLTAMHAGTEIAFVLAQITYKDNHKVHHARLCSWLQPPAYYPGIWHDCIGFLHSD